MKITLIFVIGKCPDTSSNAGRGSVGGFLQIFAAPASRPAGVFAGFVLWRQVEYPAAHFRPKYTESDKN